MLPNVVSKRLALLIAFKLCHLSDFLQRLLSLSCYLLEVCQLCGLLHKVIFFVLLVVAKVCEL